MLPISNFPTVRLGACALVALLLVSCASLREPADSERFLFLDTADTLQIRFRYSADPRLTMSAPSIADEWERKRQRDFEQAMGYLLARVGLPMNYRILGQDEEADAGHPVLDVNAMRWRQTGFGSIEAVIRVSLTSYGERNTLGTFTGEEYPPPATQPDALDRVYVETITKSLTKMLPVLLTHFESEDAGTFETLDAEGSP